jgi:hypothetical protein
MVWQVPCQINFPSITYEKNGITTTITMALEFGAASLLGFLQSSMGAWCLDSGAEEVDLDILVDVSFKLAVVAERMAQLRFFVAQEGEVTTASVECMVAGGRRRRPINQLLRRIN